MAIKKQLTISLPNAAGQLAKLAGIIARAKANIQAISVVDSTEVGMVRVVVDKFNAARTALKSSGLSFTETPVLVVSMEDKPGQLAGTAAKLAKAGINIQYVYGSTCGKASCDCEELIVICVPDPKKAEAILKK